MSGTPVIIDGTLSTAAPENLTEIAGNAVIAATAGVQEVGLRVKGTVAGDTPLTAQSSFSDGISPASGAFGIAGFEYLFDDSTSNFVRQRSNTQGTLLVSAARTASTSSSSQTNYNARGVVIFLNITVAPNTTETLTIDLFITDPASTSNGSDIAVFTTAAGSTLQSGARYVLELYPGASGTPDNASIHKVYALALPRTWVTTIVPSGSSSWTYSLGYALIV